MPSDQLSAEDLAAIRERVESDRAWASLGVPGQDRAVLLAEVERLRAKVAYAAALVSGDPRWDNQERLEQAEAEAKRLRTAVQQARSMIDDPSIDTAGDAVVRVGEILDAALSGVDAGEPPEPYGGPACTHDLVVDHPESDTATCEECGADLPYGYGREWQRTRVGGDHR